jgi:integrase
LREIEENVEILAREILRGTRAPKEEREKALSLSEGFDLALDLVRGKYATKTRRWQAVHYARNVAERILGKNTLWTELSHSDLKQLGRTLANEAVRKADGQKVLGVRSAESTIDALLSVAAWLREESMLPATTLLPMPKWRKKLKAEWAAITKTTVRPVRHRNTPEEMRALFKHVQHPDVDARFSLAFQIGGEQRIGQVIRCVRSDLELGSLEDSRLSIGPGRFGILRVPSAGNKTTSPVMLNEADRKAIDAALVGYLSLYEDAYRNGRIHDFPLFPSGRLKKGKAKVSERPTSLTRDAARKMFQQLEKIAGVEHVPGRGWYGTRRTATDLAEDLESDQRVLNALSGHRDSRTRQTIYQDENRPEVLARAAQARSRLRAIIESTEPQSDRAEIANAS